MEQRTKRVELIQGRYAVLGELGRGTSGIVFEVFDQRDQKKLALKTIRPEVQTKYHHLLLGEARLLASLSHEGLPRVFGAGQLVDERPFYTMQLIEGKTLKETITGDELSWKRQRDILVQLCEILDYVHSKGVVHRDLKPSNIMVSGDGRVSLIDWGTAEKQGEVMAQRMRPPCELFLKGTPLYLAPEIIYGEDATPSSDQYALGVIFFQWLTGSAPFVAEDSSALLKQICYHPPREFRRLMAEEPRHEIQSLCLRLLSKQPEERFGSCLQIATTLQHIDGILSPRNSWFSPPTRAA